MRSLICVCVLALLVPACAQAQGGSNGFMTLPVQVVQVEAVQTVGGSNGSVAYYAAPSAFVYARPVAIVAAPVRVVKAVFPCLAERRAARLARRSARLSARSYAIRQPVACVICN